MGYTGSFLKYLQIYFAICHYFIKIPISKMKLYISNPIQLFKIQY